MQFKQLLKLGELVTVQRAASWITVLRNKQESPHRTEEKSTQECCDMYQTGPNSHLMGAPEFH